MEATRDAIIDLRDWYMHLLTEHPLRTNAVATGVLCTVGDVLAQACEWKLDIMSPDKESYNWQRTLRMGLWGTAICGPLLCLWYRGLHAAADALRIAYAPIVSGRTAWLLERAPALQWLTNLHQPKVLPAAPSPAQLLLGKVAFDTMIFQAPFLNLYFAVMGVLEGLSLEQIVDKTRASFHRAWFLSFLVWTPVQLVNLHIVPMPLQPTVVATVMMAWQTVLSLLNHYHDHGSPRNAPLAKPATAAPMQQQQAAVGAPGGGGERLAYGGQLTSGGQTGLITGPPPYALPPAPPDWELERAQLRTRIRQLLAENRSLRYQIGQMHASAYTEVPSRAVQQPGAVQQQQGASPSEG